MASFAFHWLVDHSLVADTGVLDFLLGTIGFLLLEPHGFQNFETAPSLVELLSFVGEVGTVRRTTLVHFQTELLVCSDD